MPTSIPSVEIPNHAHAFGVRGPDDEAYPRHPSDVDHVCTERLIGTVVPPSAKRRRYKSEIVDPFE
jgi:hypothetical protein